MKPKTILSALALLTTPVAAEAKPATVAPCSGYYVTPRQSDGFSVKVESSVAEIVYVDYSPRSLMRYTRNGDGSLTFHIDNGGESRMRCSATGATLDLAATETYLHNPEQVIHSPARRVQLVRFTGDIWKYAARRRWAVGD